MTRAGSIVSVVAYLRARLGSGSVGILSITAVLPLLTALVRSALYRRTVAYGATARTKACARFARRITPFLLLAFPICVAVTGRWPAPRDNGSDIDMWPGLGCYVFASLELVQLRLWALAHDDA